jgi:hypothetical protein
MIGLLFATLSIAYVSASFQLSVRMRSAAAAHGVRAIALAALFSIP